MTNDTIAARTNEKKKGAEYDDKTSPISSGDKVPGPSNEDKNKDD